MVDNIHMRYVLVNLLILAFLASCGGGGEGPSEVADTIKEFEINDNYCQVTIDEDSSNLESILTSTCPNVFDPTTLSSASPIVLDAGNTCSFVRIDGPNTIVSEPTDDDVGSCNFHLSMNDSGSTVYAKAKVVVRNLDPILTVPNVSNIEEDSAVQVVLADGFVESSDEDYGVYSIDDSQTSGVKCSDNGTVSIDEQTGAVSFGPNLNYVGTCNVMVVFDDQNVGSQPAYSQFSITVVTNNDIPDITGSCSTASLNQDNAYNCLSLSFSDNDPEDSHTWSTHATHSCSWASVDNITGAITGTPGDDDVGGCNISVVVNDGQADSLPYTRAVTVNNVTPVIAPVTVVNAISEDASATVVISGSNITSSEEGRGVYSLDNANTTGTKCSDNGTVSIDASTGEVTYTPAANFDQNCNVRVVFDDQNPTGNTTSQEIEIVVTPINDPHSFTSTCPPSINELVTYSCNPAVSDVEGDTITWSLEASNTCSWASINATTGAVSGTPTRADVGSCNLVIRADDGEHQIDQTTAVTVNNVQPSFTIADTTLAEDSGATVIRADGDVSSTDEGYGTYSVVAASSNDCQAQGTVSVDASTGAVTFAPNINYDTNCNIRIQFDDGKASDNIGTDEFVVTMIPSPDNAMVSLPAGCDTNHDEDTVYTCTPIISDPDTGDTHTWSIDANTCAWISGIVGTTGVMTGTPNDDQVGACSFTIKATGDQDSLVTSTLTANITVDNVQPIISFATNPSTINMQHTTAPAAYASVIQNTATDFNMVSTDETYGVYSLVAPTTGTDCSTVADTLTIDSGTGVISFLPNNMYVGSCNIGVSFDDQNSVDNVAATYDFTVNVQDQVPPLISYIDSTSADQWYTLDQTVDIVVKFDEAVTINSGNPRLFLETGAVDRQAVYNGQSGDRTELYFQYTVQEDDYTTDLSVHSTVSFLDLGGADVTDDYGNTEVNFPVPKPADSTGNSLQERRAIQIDGAVARASASGLPTLVSPAQFLDVTVEGSAVVEYQYKLKQVGSANDTCADPVDYSADTAIATKITDSLTTFPLGASIRLCIVGITATGVVEPYTSAFEYVWSKDVNSVQKIDFGAVNDLPNFQDSEVDPDNRNIVYARNLLGEIYKSTDFGANWTKFCTVPQTYETNIEVSPGPDRTPYVFQSGSIFKITDKNGGACDNLLASTGLSVLTNYGRDNISFTITGDIYLLTYSNGPTEIWRTLDQGASWSLYATLSNFYQEDSLSFEMNPFDTSNFLIGSFKAALPNPNNGVYQTTDGGTSFTRVRAEFRGGYQRFDWHPTNADIVYYALRPFTEKSLDRGVNWASSGESGDTYNRTDYYRRYDIDIVTGYAYRLITSGSNTILQRSTDITSAGNTVWSSIHTFSGMTGQHFTSLNVSVSGNSATPTQPTIAVNILNNFLISSDGGSTWTEKFAPEELKLLTIAGSGDDAIYGATKDWFVVRTTNNGADWSYQVGDYYHCLGQPPKLAVNQLNTSNILMWTDNVGTVNCSNFNYSTNSMVSMISRDSFSMEAPKLVMSLSAHNPKQYYMSGKPSNPASQSFRFHTTFNSAFETQVITNSGNEFSDPMPDSYIHPHDSSKVWIVDNVGNGTLYEHDLNANTKTSLNSNTGLTSIAGIDVYIGDLGQFVLRVMDRTGRMRISTDYGVTFSDEGTTGTPLTTCNKRLLYHHPRDRNLVVTGCLYTDTVAISKNGGNTWDETDFNTEYNIDCDLRGMAVSSSRMYLGCANSDTMIFNYSFASLENEVGDSVLTAAENGVSNDLLTHFFPDLYTNIEYKVIPTASICDAAEMSSGTSATVPKTDDAAFTTRGDYKVCIKQTDAGGDSYTTTSNIFFDTGTPVFTSIDLAGNAVDGIIDFTERYSDSEIVTNLVSSLHDFVRYDVVLSSTTCDSSLDYSYETPKSNDDALFNAGTYKVCVELTTRGGTTAYGASSNFTYEPTAPYALLSNTPEAYVTTDSALDVTVSGLNVTQYKYKIVDASVTSCSSSSGYSSAIPIATKITDSLTGYSNGDNLILCVLGGNASNYFQSHQRASRHYFVYSTSRRIDPIDFSSAATTFSDWRQVAVAPSDENIIFGLNSMGEVWRSTNKGASWKHMCTIEHYRYRMHLAVSPGEDATAYISYHHRALRNNYDRVYRVDDYSGRGCSNLLGRFRGEVLSDFVQPVFSISPKGELYIVENQYDSLVVRKSLDYGRNWLFVGQLQDSGQQGRVYFNPLNENELLLNSIADNTGSGTRGLYRSTDGGETWSFVQSTGFTSAQNIFFDPINSGRVYANNQYFSTNGGASWSTNTDLDAGGNRWWVANDGKGYRLEQSGSDTVLMSDSDLSTIGFTALYTFAGVQNSDGSADIVTASGNTIAVVIGKRFYLSIDGGSNFSQVMWPGKGAYLTGISSTDGERAYGIVRGWSIFESNDYANNWTFEASSFSESCGLAERIFAHPLNDDYVWTYGEGCNFRAYATTDSFLSRSSFYEGVGTSSLFASTSLLGGYVYIYRSSGTTVSHSRTTNSWASVATDYSDQFSDWGTTLYKRTLSFSKVSDPHEYLTLTGGDLQELRTNPESEYSNITYRLSFSDPQGMAILTDKDHLEVGHLFISERGKMNYTFDDGKSFTSLGNTGSPLPTCEGNDRYLYVNQKNNDLIATSCYGQNQLSWTTNGGTNWTTVDLETTYNMNCGLRSVVIDDSKIMFSCSGWVQGMKFSHTPVDLIGVASDSIIRSDEVSGVDIVQIDYPTYYSSIDYAIIDSSASCSSATPGFSATVPQDTDLVADGSYKICARLVDGSGTSYKASTIFIFDDNPASFTSIDLNGVAIDGIQLIDYEESTDDIVTNLVASNYSNVRYALVSDTTICNGNITYSSTVPKVNSELLQDAGDYKVCVAVSDGVNDPAFGSSATFSFSKDYVEAKLSGVPTKVTDDTALNITVSGSGVDSYRYKLGVSPVDCSSDTGYSAETSIATPITDSLVAYSSSNVDICVQGIDNTTHRDQILRSATVYSFAVSDRDINYTNFSINNFARDWFDVEVAKWQGKPYIFARDFEGNIFRSIDRGSSFEFLCQVPHDSESRIIIAPRFYQGAYATASGNAYRIEDRLGGVCPLISSGFTSVVSTYRRAPIAFTKDAMLMMDEVDTSSTILKKSFDNGETWSTLRTFTDVGTNLTIYVDPFNDENFFITYEGTSITYPGRWIISRNGGSSVTGIDPAGPDDVTVIQDVNIDFRFDPNNKGYVVANNGRYSNSNLKTFNNNNGIVSNFERWDFDNTSKAYRLVQNGADIDIEVSNAINIPSFSVLDTLSSITASETQRTISVSEDSATIAIVANRRMFISLDAGAFNEIYTPKPKITLSSVNSEDNTKVYGIDDNWNTYKSIDSSASWTKEATFSNGCTSSRPRIRSSKANTDYVVGYADTGVSGCDDYFASKNGLTSISNITNLYATSTSTLIMDPANADNAGFLKSDEFKRTTNFFDSRANESLANVTNNPHGFDGFMSTVDSTMIYNVASNNLYEVNTTAGTKTDITSSLSFSNPSTVEGFADGSLYVISQTGALDQSLNDGTSYAPYAANPGLTSCTQRILKTLSTDISNYITTGCFGGTTLAYTTDAGVNWTEIDLSSYSFSNTCLINDYTLVDQSGIKKLIVACRDESSIEIGL